MLRLKKWPFSQEEVVKLIWIKSPFKNKRNEWILPLLFRGETGNLVKIETPWGSLPWLRFGQGWVNGQPLETDKDGSISRIEFGFTSWQGSICRIDSLPQEYFGANLRVNQEHLWSFYIKDKIAFVPCIEIIRSFFTPNSTMARTILEPSGLDFIISSIRKANKQLVIEFDRQVSSKLLNDNFVKYAAWLKLDKFAYETWSSVLQSVFPRGHYEEFDTSLFINKSDSNIDARTIQASPPIPGPSCWDARILDCGSYLWVMEIVAVGGLSFPFEKITWSRIGLEQKLVDPSIRGYVRKTRAKKPKDQLKQLNLTDSSPSQSSKAATISIQPTIMSFGDTVDVIKQPTIIPVPSSRNYKHSSSRQMSKRERRELEIKRHQEKLRNLEQEHKEQGRREVLFSSAETGFDGFDHIRPIELMNLRIIESSNPNGLEDFCRMIGILKGIDSKLIIKEPKIMFLPSGRSFSFNENGTMRRFALVQVKCNGKFVYILEVERVSKVNLSTLLILPRNNKKLTESDLAKVIEEVLSGLIQNNGHWVKSLITSHPKVRIERIKHLEDWDLFDWAWVIYQRINLLYY